MLSRKGFRETGRGGGASGDNGEREGDATLRNGLLELRLRVKPALFGGELSNKQLFWLAGDGCMRKASPGEIGEACETKHERTWDSGESPSRMGGYRNRCNGMAFQREKGGGQQQTKTAGQDEE